MRTVDYSELVETLSLLHPVETNLELIRVGGDGDGGYIVPRDFDGVIACFSPGAAGTWNFEKELHNSWNIPIFIMDRYESRPDDLNHNVSFDDSWLGPSDSEGFTSINTWIEKYFPKTPGDFILQMDIEGAEYQSILSMSDDNLKRFRIIVIELHFTQNFMNRLAFQMIYKPFFEKLNKFFDVIHLHPNNCCGEWNLGEITFPNVVEITFHRRNSRGKRELVNGNLRGLNLDQVNTSKKPALRMKFDWMKKY